MESESLIGYILSEDKKARKKGLEYLYHHCLPKIQSLIKTGGGTAEEANDIFQDAVTVVYKNLLEAKFRSDSSLTSYTYAIARNLWYMQLRKKKIVTTPLSDEQLKEEREVVFDSGRIKEVLRLLDGGCHDLLIGFYFHNKSMSELALNFGFSSSQVAKTKKLRCLRKLSEILQRYGLSQDHFTL